MSSSTSSTSSAKKWQSKRKSEEIIIGYVHNLASVKRNRGNTMDYVSMTLQTSPNTSCEARLYSPQNRTLFAESQTRRTPFKLRDFTCTDDQKMVANDMTFVGVPHQSEYSSQQAEVPSQFSKESVKVLEVLNTIKEWDSVVVRGKITQINETTNVGSKGLKLSQAVITDATASIQLENSARCMLDNRQVSAMWHDACWQMQKRTNNEGNLRAHPFHRYCSLF